MVSGFAAQGELQSAPLLGNPVEGQRDTRIDQPTLDHWRGLWNVLDHWSPLAFGFCSRWPRSSTRLCLKPSPNTFRSHRRHANRNHGRVSVKRISSSKLMQKPTGGCISSICPCDSVSRWQARSQLVLVRLVVPERKDTKWTSAIQPILRVDLSQASLETNL